jgi:hypothetical protein
MKPKQDPVELMSELLVMPDGQIYVHNLTPEMAAVLRELNPGDETIARRVITHVNKDVKKLLPPSWHAKDPTS